MYRVLLISYVNWDSLIEIPTLLKNGGCIVDIFSTKNSWVLQNKSFNKFIEASNREDQFIQELLDFYEQHKGEYDWFLPGDDAVLRLLNDRITDEEAFYELMPLSKIENRQLLGSKAGFSTLCSKYDIKTPRYLIYEEGMSAGDIGDYMKYPFLIKIDRSEGGYGVFLCENQKDLVENLNNIKDKRNLVFQQFILGYDINIEGCFKDGGLLVYNYSKTLKIMGKFGVSTQRLFYQNQSIEPELFKIGRCLGINGFANIVFMFNELDNTHYLIEVDVRPNAWMYYGKFTGSDFSKAVNKVVNGDLSMNRVEEKFIHKKTLICLYKKDVHRCIQEKDFKGLLYWLINKDNRWRYIPLYDSKMFRACNQFLWKTFVGLCRQKIGKIFRKASAN